MKKVYFFAVALTATTTLFSQDGIDSVSFESYNLNGNDYYNGDDENGNILIGDFTLSNSYNTQWDSWSGFAISKVQDNTTAGFGNQYASYTNGGANGSSQYGIWYDGGTIEFNQLRVVHSLQITNTTYAALSMRDGDQYSKQFGSANGPDGQPDGTNGEDWLLLQIIPLNENDELVGDTIDFYLADYRFANNNDDYIVDTWETITFNNLVAKKLKFLLSSSDNGQWGMNTPGYFAIDNVAASPTVGLDAIKQLEATIYPNPASSEFTVVTTEDAEMEVFNIFGQVVKTATINGSLTLDVSNLPAGVYSVVLNTSTKKSVHKLVVQ